MSNPHQFNLLKAQKPVQFCTLSGVSNPTVEVVLAAKFTRALGWEDLMTHGVGYCRVAKQEYVVFSTRGGVDAMTDVACAPIATEPLS